MDFVDAIRPLLQGIFPGLLGLELTAASADAVTATLTVRPDLCTVGDILHGGAIMAFADALGAIATLVNLPPGGTTATIESKTNFFRPATVGTTVTGRTIALNKGKRLTTWETRITDAEAGTWPWSRRRRGCCRGCRSRGPRRQLGRNGAASSRASGGSPSSASGASATSTGPFQSNGSQGSQGPEKSRQRFSHTYCWSAAYPHQPVQSDTARPRSMKKQARAQRVLSARGARPCAVDITRPPARAARA
jgi:uncharacterized protein (TIGR00369 family)